MVDVLYQFVSTMFSFCFQINSLNKKNIMKNLNYQNKASQSYIQHRYNIASTILLVLFYCSITFKYEKSHVKTMEEIDGNWPTFEEGLALRI